MKVHRYSEHQRRLWLHEMMHKTRTIKAICKEAAISRATLYNWRDELNIIDEKKKQEEAQATASLSWQPNDKYKMLVSVLVKTDADKTVSGKLARELMKRYNLTVSQACALVEMPEEMFTHRPRKPEANDIEVYAALVHLLEEKTNRSLDDCITVLQQSHPLWAVKQIKRIYRQGRLYLKRTRIRRIASASQETQTTHTVFSPMARLQRQANFWHIGLLQEERCWLLFLLDYEDGTPLNAIPGDGEINVENVMQFIVASASEIGLPKKIRLPAAAPFSSRELSKWSWENRIALHQLSMAKPENLLEAGYIKDDIKKQLKIDETTTLENLQTIVKHWLKSFVEDKSEATNYFAKETVV